MEFKVDEKKMFWLWLATSVCIALTGVAFGLVDADFYWQSKLGMHELLYQDFSTHHLLWGEVGLGEYLDHEWLCNILFYVCKTPFITKLVICLVTGVFFGLTTKPGIIRLSAILAYCLLFCRIKAASFSVLYLMAEVLLLGDLHKDKKWTAKMCLLLVLWNNTHSGSVILFFLVAGAWFIFGCKDHKRVLLAAVLCVLLLGLTPYGYRLMLFNFSHMTSSGMSEVVKDWHPLDCTELMGWVSLALCIFTLLAQKKSLWRQIAVIGICIMTFRSERFGVYLFPFLLTADFKDIAIDITILVMSVILGVIGVIGGLRGGEQYNFSYGDRFEGIIRDGEGLFNDYDVTSGKDIKGFINGAYPLCRERTLDSLVLRYYGGEESIEKLINYYGLDRFVFCKYNMQCGFYNVTNPLYDYLTDRPDEYKCLYDDGMFVYFESE